MADKSFLVSIILKAKNEASSQLKDLNKWTEVNKKQFKDIAKAAAAMGAATSIAIGMAIKKASDLEETQSKFNVVFAEQARLAEQWADELQRGFAMSEIEAKRFLSSVQDMLVPMGMGRESAAKLSNEMVKLAADVGSFNNMPTAQVMQDIQSALAGMPMPMRKYGVMLSATKVEQEALNMGLMRQGEELTDSAKAMATYSLILKGTKDAQGDMARTMGSFANQSKLLRANIENLLTQLGKAFLPIAAQLIQILNNSVLPALVEWAKQENNVAMITERVGNVLKFLINIVTGIVAAFDLAGTAAATFALALTGNLKAAKLGFTELKNKITDYGETMKTVSQTSAEEFVNNNAIAQEDFATKMFTMKEIAIETQAEIDAARTESQVGFVEGWQMAFSDVMASQVDYYAQSTEFFNNFRNAYSQGFQTMLNGMGKGWKGFSDGFMKIGEGIKNAAIKYVSDIAAQWAVKHAAMTLKTIIWGKKEIATNAAVAASKAAAASAWTTFGALAVAAAIFAGVIAYSNQFANGVTNFSGGTALVGERGPELVSLPAGSSVFSNRKSAGMLAGGGGGIVVNVNLSGNYILDEDSAEGLADVVGDVIMQRVKNEVKV